MRTWVLTAGTLVLGCQGPQRPVVVGPPQRPVVAEVQPSPVQPLAPPVVAPAVVETVAPTVPATVPAYEVAVIGGKVRARWQDRFGAVPVPRVPRKFCCEWTARSGTVAPDGNAVVVDVTMACDKPIDMCDEVAAETAAAQVTVPLDGPVSPKPRYRRLPDSVVERMPDALGAKQQLANILYVGPFGPSPDGVLVLHVDDAGALGGFLHTVIGGQVRRVPVPELPWVMHEVTEIVYADADGDGADEAVVLVNALTGFGPTGNEEFSGAHVLKWDGTQLVTLPKVELRLAGATTPGEVRWRLQRPNR